MLRSISESPFTGDPATGQPNALFAWDLGYMVNIAPHHSLGATLNITQGLPGSGDYLVKTVAIKPRIRFWLDSRFSVDAAGGVILGGSGESGPKSPSFTSLLAISLSDWISISTQIEVHKYVVNYYDWEAQTVNSRLHRSAAFFIGIRFGSYPGAVLGGIAATVTPLLHTLSYVGS
ncbi:MAG TPA: hypothetical protein VN285_02430 [Candidatus Deferrimicrobium sp.]|nr:hypothetical protein [Candidatus Deferrimicrobium sp.]